MQVQTILINNRLIIKCLFFRNKDKMKRSAADNDAGLLGHVVYNFKQNTPLSANPILFYFTAIWHIILFVNNNRYVNIK